ncbi:MAG: hexulose-6-phosphate isomerase [Rectinemataceae bacterium]|jgi:hypothetical protein
MNAKARRTLEAVFGKPTRADISWADIEALSVGLGAEVTESSGSRVRICLSGVRYIYHRPHPERTACKGAVETVREHLTRAGVKP